MGPTPTLLFNTDDVYMVNNYPDFEFAIRLAGQHTLEAAFFDL